MGENQASSQLPTQVLPVQDDASIYRSMLEVEDEGSLLADDDMNESLQEDATINALPAAVLNCMDNSLGHAVSISSSQPGATISNDVPYCPQATPSHVPRVQRPDSANRVVTPTPKTTKRGCSLVFMGVMAKEHPCGGGSKSISELIVVEVCAGSAKLSAVARSRGFHAVAIDGPRNEHKPRVKIVTMDLCKEGAWEKLEAIIREPGVHAVHFAPPCGTASRARDKAVPQWLQALGVPSPPPLRSMEYPWGIPEISSEYQVTKLEAANMIYRIVARGISLCLQLSIIVSAENPFRSYFWEVPCIKPFKSHPALEWLLYDGCMVGGDRNKRSGLLATKGVFTSLFHRLCDERHQHAPWQARIVDGVPLFDTASEAEYASLLCNLIVNDWCADAVKKGFCLPPASISDLHEVSDDRYRVQAAVGKQPRGRKLPPLVSEFSSITEIVTNSRLQPTLSPYQTLLRKFVRQGAKSASPADRKQEFEEQGHGKQEDLKDEKGHEKQEDLKDEKKEQQMQEDEHKEHVFIVGNRRDPQQFVEAALKAGHPYSPGNLVPDGQRRALAKILIEGPVGISRLRLQFIKKAKELAVELADEEKELHEKIPKHARNIMASKKLALFRRLLQDAGYADLAVVDEMISGVATMGKVSKTGLWRPNLVPATSTSGELQRNSKWLRPAVLAKAKKQSDLEIAKFVYDQTRDELLKENWITGPYSHKELDEMFPEGWLPIPRFGLRQGKKIRNIDDCKFPGLNTALTVTEKLRLQDVDDVCALVAYATQIISSAEKRDRSFECQLSDGTVIRGVIHADWGNLTEMKLLGRTLDLRAAYKNLFNSESSLWAAVLAVYNPSTKEVELYRSEALMFGATASVYGFNRVAKALQFLLESGLSLLVCQFFDDFPSVDFGMTASAAQSSAQALLALLGWGWATGEKAPPFDPLFDALGVRFDIDMVLKTKKFLVMNKPSRIDAMVQQFDDIDASDEFSPPLAAEVAGKVQFAHGQTFGDGIRPALAVVRERANARTYDCGLTADIRAALKFAKDFFLTARPREISCCLDDTPIIIFTDGSSERLHLWGAVIFNLSLKPIVTAGEIPGPLSELWKRAVGDQIICEVEMYPVVLAKTLLQKALSGRRVIWYIDNDAAKDGLATGRSGSHALRVMLYEFSRIQCLEPSFNWFARVPSASNIADEPSRGEARKCAERLGTVVTEWSAPAGLCEKIIQDTLRKDLINLKRRSSAVWNHASKQLGRRSRKGK